MKILGVKRKSKYSPNHVNNDEMIFNLTGEIMRQHGAEIEFCSEADFLKLDNISYQKIFTMARDTKVVKKMQKLEKNGCTIINSPSGITNCFRSNLTRLLVNNHIPYPESRILNTLLPDMDQLDDSIGDKGYWIKRGDFHAIHREDVTFVATKEEAKQILKEFHLRNIPDAVVSKNLIGDLVKFYGVSSSGFFYWFYPYDHNHYKFKDYETINGKSNYYDFDVNKLQQITQEASEIVQVPIYGGDAIIEKDGTISIIDFNDWPSFAPCRDEASKYIAAYLMNQFKIS